MIFLVALSLWFNWYIVFFLLGLYCIPIWFIIFLRQLVEHFHPLYAFWNLWSKIQSLTPRISLQSEKIEKEFSSDMNFHILSDSFDTLSSDFQKIIGYVIKLEQIEKKANKWNLFDSEKYITSLREDITKPLISLKSFLEKQKKALEVSQEELQEMTQPQEKVRVRAGWMSQWNQSTQKNQRTELIGNAELSSKRTEPLIAELTENIEKLEVMVGKFEF